MTGYEHLGGIRVVVYSDGGADDARNDTAHAGCAAGPNDRPTG